MYKIDSRILKSAIKVPVLPIPALQCTTTGGIFWLSSYFDKSRKVSIWSKTYSISTNTFSSFLAVSSSQFIKFKWSIYNTLSSVSLALLFCAFSNSPTITFYSPIMISSNLVLIILSLSFKKAFEINLSLK